VRILVVDDDATSKTNARMLLQNIGHCDEAGDRASALTCFQAAIEAGQPYRLVLVDIQLTDSGNDSILAAFRDIENRLAVSTDSQARIFVTTSLSGRQLETDCLMKGGDEFFSKPLDKTRLLKKIKSNRLLAGQEASSGPARPPGNIIETTAILDAISRKMKKGDLTLPPAPKIAMRLRQMIDCNAEIKDVVELLEQDLAVATKLISASNSAFYRGVKKSTTLAQATSRLGLSRTREVVMAICCRGYFSTNHPPYKDIVDKLWWHSLACAHTAEMVVDRLGWTVDEDIFSIGILHDIGKLLMVHVAGELVQRKKGIPAIDQDELHAALDSHHERLGAAILRKMGYPEAFADLVEKHHQSKDPATTPKALQVLQQANLLARTAGFGLGRDTPESLEMLREHLGISEKDALDAVPEISQRMDQLRYVFG